MKRWTVIVDDVAREDLLAIVPRIAADSGINADRILDRLEARINSLDHVPERGRVVPELHACGITTIREIFEKPWRILYELEEHEAHVVAIFDGRRNLEEVLLERFLR